MVIKMAFNPQPYFLLSLGNVTFMINVMIPNLNSNPDNAPDLQACPQDICIKMYTDTSK